MEDKPQFFGVEIAKSEWKMLCPYQTVRHSLVFWAERKAETRIPKEKIMQ